MLYKSSYKAFKTTDMTCIVIWVILILTSTVWNIGIIQVLIITTIWEVLIFSYSIEVIKFQKTGKK
ncbi:DUF3169 family protein [uncultured Clostridium sp.]|uniref:DUF3169 family protein n=1 Tax=uncultured Clostridium sp. TaxID=59620 RepID=UPI003450B839